MKKVAVIMLALILVMILLTSCTGESKATETEPISTEETSVRETQVTIETQAEALKKVPPKLPAKKETAAPIEHEPQVETEAPPETPTESVAELQSESSIETETSPEVEVQTEAPIEVPTETAVPTEPDVSVYDSRTEYDAAIAYLTEKGCVIDDDNFEGKIGFWYGSCRCRIYDGTSTDGVWYFSGGDSVVNEPFRYTCGKGELLDIIKLVVQ